MNTLDPADGTGQWAQSKEELGERHSEVASPRRLVIFFA
jgi:hypothetical protein